MDDKTTAEIMEQTRYRILLIEDDKLDQMAFERFVRSEKLPYDYRIAGSVSEARKILDCEQFDVIVADYSLGDGTAMDILSSVEDLPIILTTGAADERVAIEAWKAGAYDYIAKDSDRTYLKAIPKAVENAIDRMKMEKALERKQKNLEAIFDAAPIGMLLANENMVITRVNYAVRQMLHRDYPQIINRQIGDALGCIRGSHGQRGCENCFFSSGCLLRQAMEIVRDLERPVHDVEMYTTLKIYNQETKLWLRISAEPVRIDDRKYVLLAIDDITERKQAEEEHRLAEEKLKETMELKSQFISTVSHEIRTPLAAIKEGIAIVLDEVTGPINEDQKKFLDIVKRNTDRLSDLINNVLDFQKLGSDNTIPDIQSNDIEQILSDVHETMALYAKRSEVELSVDCARGLPKAEFDRDKIIQVLTNLVSNAIKFTPRQGRVSVNVRHREGELVIGISDTGMGIPKEALPKIFERFYRVKRPGKEIQGTGLGLAIVHKIVMMHGGRIEVESEIDRGTAFTVFLPVKAKSPPEQSSTQMDELLENSITG